MKPQLRILFILYFMFSLSSCEDFLDEKPDIKLKDASTLADLHALLNNTAVMNYYTMGIGEASADNYYLETAAWQSLPQHERDMYIWEGEIFHQFYLNAWLDYYQTVYYSNYILKKLEEFSSGGTDLNLSSEIKGKAVFFRGFAFFKLLTLFSKAYDKQTASTDLGIPLRLDDDFNTKSERASVESCYRQIIIDLELAAQLLPNSSANKHSPSKNAAFILLSWVHLAMQEFEGASGYAEKSLQISDRLLNYKNYNAAENYPFVTGNDENVFTVASGSLGLLGYWNAKIDTTLFKSYADGDFRKSLFFGKNSDGSAFFKGSYTGSNGLFMGLTTADAYLNIAESLIRMNRVFEGLAYLEKLLKMRYQANAIPNLPYNSTQSALELVLEERRKEFVMRDSRWIDIKRLNKHADNSISIKRILRELKVELKPNDNRYALPLPQEIIELTGMQQNPH
ncbi:MAG: RagB/SusD family nutrient uptake outer membrane protein [Flavobacterium sp.]|nr:MAG: RagB/SusD family nutrient uptake outer membrane protein [Flavobacterium sp.]